jgi:DNA-binding HxlR family transcriptional regulator
MGNYHQFCPVAKASEIFAERWTPLILRELLMGSHRFNEIENGLPHISHSLLTQRLRSLEEAGIVERRTSPSGGWVEYHLTPPGEELYEVIERLGEWGQRWMPSNLHESELDPELLMWDMRRRIHLDRLPGRRVVVQFDFTGARRGSYWLVLDHGDVSVCLKHPGFDIDLLVTADTMTLHQIWLGRQSIESALRSGTLELTGPSELRRAFPGWLKLSTFAHVPRAAQPLAQVGGQPG